METWRTATIVLYSALGAIAGLFIGGLLILGTLAVVAVRNDPLKLGGTFRSGRALHSSW